MGGVVAGDATAEDEVASDSVPLPLRSMTISPAGAGGVDLDCAMPADGALPNLPWSREVSSADEGEIVDAAQVDDVAAAQAEVRDLVMGRGRTVQCRVEDELVRAGSAGEAVPSRATEEVVVASAAIETVVARQPDQYVIAVVAAQSVVVLAAIEKIVAGAATQAVIANAATQEINAAIARKRVVAGITVHVVRGTGTTMRIVPLVSDIEYNHP